ncbi:MAG TPA: extracellular solute-binding protein [Firmicutes bacterium]|nr:extracellular solute-binding protein [Bacillota bacterium]
MKKQFFGTMSALIAACIGISAAACAPSNPTNEAGVVRIFTYTGQEYDSVTMDSVMNAIQDKVGLEIRFEGASVEDYYTRLTPMMGSGDWPDLIWSDPENSAGAFQTWADPAQDMLWNLDELLIGNEDRYPYLNKLVYSDQYKNIMYYDGHYIVPEVQTSTAWAIYYRADWLEAIGFVDDEGNARAPVTLDEFEYVMSRFSGTDLFTDANGNKSGTTYGISPNTSNFYVNPLYGAFGITPDWDIDDDGNVSYMYAREEFKPYLEWMHAMYEEGWIDPVFNQNTGYTDRDAWYNGKVGCIMTNGEGHMEWVVGNFENSQGENKVIVGPAPVGTGNTSELTGCTLGVEGESGFSNWGGYYGGYAVTKGTADPYKTLDLLEYLVSPEGSVLRLYGIEGQHFYYDDEGNVVVDLDGRNSERINYFATVNNPDGTETCAGLHKMGELFGYNVDWDYFEQTGEIAVATDIGALYPKYSGLVSQAIEYTKDLQTPRLLNVTAYPSTISTMRTEVMNISSQFINRAIIGTVDLDTDWQAMLANLDGAGYQTVKAVMKETAESLGIL